VSELYQLATLYVMSFGYGIRRFVVSTHHIQRCQVPRATEQSVICEEEGGSFEEALRATLISCCDEILRSCTVVLYV
jgi:hypothetical protein